MFQNMAVAAAIAICLAGTAPVPNVSHSPLREASAVNLLPARSQRDVSSNRVGP